MTVAWSAPAAHAGSAPPAARAGRAAQAVAAAGGSGAGGAPRFRIWREPCGCRPYAGYHWAWECTLCHPPARGSRHGTGAWHMIIRTTLPYHWRVRRQHHRWMARRIRA